MDTVLLEKLPDDSRIAVLTVNRPEVLNALNDSVMEGLAAALDALEGDASVKAVILTGAGERAFVAGADISEFAARSPAEHYAVCMAAHGLFSRLETLDKVTIAAVGGWALGGRLRALDVLRFARRLGERGLRPAGGHPGHHPGYGGTQRLARLVGMGRAKELIYTAGRVDARRAYEIGLVNRVVETHDELLPECVKLARGIPQKQLQRRHRREAPRCSRARRRTCAPASRTRPRWPPAPSATRICARVSALSWKSASLTFAAQNRAEKFYIFHHT